MHQFCNLFPFSTTILFTTRRRNKLRMSPPSYTKYDVLKFYTSLPSPTPTYELLYFSNTSPLPKPRILAPLFILESRVIYLLKDSCKFGMHILVTNQVPFSKYWKTLKTDLFRLFLNFQRPTSKSYIYILITCRIGGI